MFFKKQQEHQDCVPFYLWYPGIPDGDHTIKIPIRFASHVEWVLNQLGAKYNSVRNRYQFQNKQDFDQVEERLELFKE